MSSPIKDVLKTLHHNADVVEQALHGVIESEGTNSNPSIAALRQASALRAAGEDGYRLHPRLREYLHDHLQLFPAFQILAEIGSRISQVNNLWMEVDDIRRSADTETVNTIVDTIQTTVFDIADSVDRNMLFLQTLMSTRYGNVRSLEAKKSQNRFYQQQTNTLADDLTRLSRVCDKVEHEASTRGMEDLARFIRRNLLSRILVWQQSMSEMQTHLSKEIYRMREVERNHKLLARMDMLLRQQPGWRGFEADLRGDIPDLLMAASLPAIAAHVEPLDTDAQIFDEMQKLAAALPAKQIEPEPLEVKRYLLHKLATQAHAIIHAGHSDQPTAAQSCYKQGRGDGSLSRHFTLDVLGRRLASSYQQRKGYHPESELKHTAPFFSAILAA